MHRIFVTTASALLTLGLCGAAFAAPVTGRISLSGNAESANNGGMGTATGLNFASGSVPTISGTSGGLYSFGAGTGSFAAIGGATSTSGAAGTIKNIADFSTLSPTASELTFDTGGPGISFDVTSITSVSHTADINGGSVSFSAAGTINFDGFDATPGVLAFTDEGDNIVPFSATLTASVPEPASLSILGTAGFMLLFRTRRRRS